MYPIPANATRIQYLESTGTQYIDTGCRATGSLFWEIVAEATQTTTQRIGAAQATPTVLRNHISIPEASNKLTAAGYNTTVVNSAITNISGVHTLRLYVVSGTVKFSVDGVDSSQTAQQETFDIGANFYIFARNNKTDISLSSMRVYSAKFYDGSVLVRSFVPVRVGQIGYLFDKVSGQLFGNAGTGDFVLGPDTFAQGVIPTRMMPMGVRRKQAGPQIPYVTDGLVAWWDGIWNAGLGVHDAAATMWKDLVGTRDLALNSSGVSWADNALVSAISTRNAAEYTGGVPTTDFYTVELVKGVTTGRSVLVLGGTAARTDTGFVLNSGETSFRVATGANNTARREVATGASINSVRHLSVRYSAPGSTATSVLADGVALALSHDGTWGGSNDLRGLCVFGRSAADAYGSNGYPVRGSCHCLRLYNRALTDAEVAANYAVDKERFGLP